MSRASGSNRVPDVSKTMSLTLDEFLRSLKVLGGDAVLVQPTTTTAARLRVGDGHVDIEFSKREGATLGGLLKLPRAQVTIRFTGVGPDSAQDFLQRFDRAFQRGGG